MTVGVEDPAPQGIKLEEGTSRKWKFGIVAVLFLFTAAASIADALVYLYSDKGFVVNSAVLDFSGEADADLEVSGSVRLQSQLHSYGVSGGVCELMYAGDADSGQERIADLYSTVNTHAETDSFRLRMQLQDPEYAKMRSFLWDMSQGSSSSRASVNCDVDFTLLAYSAVPVQHTYSFSQDIDMTESNGVKSSKAIGAHEQFSAALNTQVGSNVGDLRFPLSVPLTAAFPFPVKSFVLNVPEIQYDVTTTKNSYDTGYFVSTSATKVDLVPLEEGAESSGLDTVLTLGCSHRDSADSCALTEALHFQDWMEDIKAGHVTVSASTPPRMSNFFSRLLGETHFVEARKRGHVDESFASTRYLPDLISPRDPDVSDGAECVVVDADNAYDSFICQSVEDGFYIFYLDIADNSGLLGHFKGVTSWSQEGEFAFVTDMEAVYTGGYVATANISSSCDYKNASLLFDYYESGVTRIHTNVFSWWDFENEGSSGDVRYIMQFNENLSSDNHEILSEGVLTYGDNRYFTQFTLNETNPSLVAQSLLGVGDGGYGGVPFNWWLALDKGSLLKDGVLQGVAEGSLSSDIASSGDSAEFDVYFFLGDSDLEEQMYLTTDVNWFSSGTWYYTGDVHADSEVRILNDMFGSNSGNDDSGSAYLVDRAVTLELTYDDGEYESKAVVRPSTDLDGIENAVGAEGGYGGDYYDWWVSVEKSFLYSDYEKVGSAVGMLALDAESNGGYSFFVRAFDGDEEQQCYVDSNVEWYSMTAWLSDGNVDGRTTVLSGDTSRVHVGTILYDDGEYSFASELNDGEELVYNKATAIGEYAGDFNYWWVSLTESFLLWDQAVIGNAIGHLSGSMEDSGSVRLEITAFDKNDSEQCYVETTVLWSSLTTWYSAGSVDIDSVIESPGFDREFILEFDYDDNEYDYNSMLTDHLNRIYNMANIAGNYGGVFGDWWVTVLESSFIWAEKVIGTATGKLTVSVDTTGAIGIRLNTINAQEVNTCDLDSLVFWTTPSTWYSAGSVRADTVVISRTYGRNFSLSFDYDDGEFNGFARSMDRDDTVLQGIAGNGRYGGTSLDWWGALDYGDLVYDEAFIGSASGELGLAVDNDGRIGQVYFNGKTMPGTSESTYIDTANKILWEGSSDRAYGYILTDTSISGSPEFMLKSYVNVDLVSEIADFLFVSAAEGVEGANCSGTAWYDEETGFMTGMDITLLYEKSLIFDSNVYLNAMTTSIDSLPPTVSPTSSPTRSPTRYPSRAPTRRPTTAPTKSSIGTYIEFTVDIIMNGVEYSSFINDASAEEASILTTRDALNPHMKIYEVSIDTEETTQARRHLRIETNRVTIRQLSSDSTKVEFVVRTNIDDLGYSNADDAYDSLVDSLADSVASGEYTTMLVENGNDAGTATLVDANVTDTPVASDYTTFEQKSDGGGDSNDDIDIGIVVGASIGGVLALVVIAGAVYWFVFRTGVAKQEPPSVTEKHRSEFASKEQGEEDGKISNPLRKEGKATATFGGL